MRGRLTSFVMVILIFAIAAAPVPARGAPVTGSRMTCCAPPANLLIAVPTSSELDLTWSPPGDGSTPDSYNIYMGTSSGGETYYDNTANPNYSITGLSADTTYYFFVTAVDTSDSESGATFEISQTTQPANSCSSPSPPVSLIPSGVSDSEVQLSWSPPSAGSAPVGYNVYQGTAPGGESPIPVASTTGTGAAVTTVVPGTTNYFAVATVDGCGNESLPVETSVSVPAAPGNGHHSDHGGGGGQRQPPGWQRAAPGWQQQPPGRGFFGIAGGPRRIGSSVSAGAPLRLIVTAVKGSTVDLSWTRPGGHSLVAGYNVYGGISPNRENIATPLNPVMITQTGYAVTRLTPSRTYYFRVTTVDTSGRESHPSNEARATTTVMAVGHRTSRDRGAGSPLLTFVVGPVGLLTLAIGGALLLMRLRSRRAAARRGRLTVPGMDVRAVPSPGPPAVVSIRTGAAGAGAGGDGSAGPRTVRIVPHTGTSSVTIDRTPR